MRNNGSSLPDVASISRLIDTLRDYALKSAREQWAEHMSDTYLAPCLTSWDAVAWFEFSQDWRVVDYLLSDAKKAKVLMRSLQCCLQWYGQNEIEDVLQRARIVN